MPKWGARWSWGWKQPDVGRVGGGPAAGVVEGDGDFHSEGVLACTHVAAACG